MDLQRALIHITLLPGTSDKQHPEALLDFREDSGRDASLEPIQLLEGAEYRYRIDCAAEVTRVETDRPEIFQPDDDSGRGGRLRPGMHVGRLPVNLTLDDTLASVAFEVRSRKLEYLTQYRWMLRDIAEVFAEAIMERFGPTEEQFQIDESGNARTLYQRFAFLNALLKDEQFQSAIRLILSRPYVAWQETEEPRAPSGGIRASSHLSRQLCRPGARTSYTVATSAGMIPWPRRMHIRRTDEVLDNPPNRFVKFALRKWRSEFLAILKILEAEKTSAPVGRGVEEVTQAVNELETVLSAPLFSNVETVAGLPTANPVLLRKEGYREILRAFIQAEMAARLAWDGGEDIYSAGQRNVATLYEFWSFVQLAQVLANLCDTPLDLKELLRPTADGLNILLTRGRETHLTGVVSRLDRRMQIELWFNRSFPGRGSAPSSWSRRMRPDCSILIRPMGSAADDFRSVWIHFDAKYRADELVDVFGLDEDAEKPKVERSVSKRDDLLKMHAYRDSIRRSAGAYVLYPGSQDDEFREYHELLPGLGAFALKPSQEGKAFGEQTLSKFLDDVISHTASQFTQHERGRYWSHNIFKPVPPDMIGASALSFLNKPPADVRVLVGYTKSEQHLQWVLANRLYNLRADERRRGRIQLNGSELGAEYVLLYGNWSYRTVLQRVSGGPLLLQKDDLAARDYPNPKGDTYLCVQLADLDADWPDTIDLATVNRLRRHIDPNLLLGAPFVVTWQTLMEATARP